MNNNHKKLFGQVLILAAIFLWSPFGFVEAYAPGVSGVVRSKETGKELKDIYIQWEATENACGDTGGRGPCNDYSRRGYSSEAKSGQGDKFYRYAGSNQEGSFFFPRWDGLGRSDGEGATASSPQGKKEYETFINLDYDAETGQAGRETRQASHPLYNLFNCNNEYHRFSVKLPPELEGATVTGRWRMANNQDWSDTFQNNVVLITGQEFNNSVDYIIEFEVEVPKKVTSRLLSNEQQISTPDTSSQLQQSFEGSLDDITDVRSFDFGEYQKTPVCIQTEVCTGDDANCSATDSKTGNHRVKLKNIREAHRILTVGNPAVPIWLVECIQDGSPDNPTYTCTTGDSQLDTNKVFGVDNAAKLRQKYNYSAELFNADGKTKASPEVTLNTRQDEFEWVTKLDPKGKQVSSVFMALYMPDATQPVDSQAQFSQKQATLDFSDACRLVIDPYGTVFDNHTLEPVSDVTVELSKKRTDKSFTPVRQAEVIGSFINPQTTQVDGRFSFFVPAGSYALKVDKQGYTYPALPLNPKADDLYGSIYSGDEIKVVDTMIEANIPVEPQDKMAAEAYARSNSVLVLSQFQSIDKVKNNYTIQGSVSHPKTKIVVYAKTPHKYKPGTLLRTRELARTTSDTQGYFTVTIDMDALRPGDLIGELVLEKATPYKTEPTVVELDPVLNYLEGYAVTAGGVILPGSKVGIYMPSSSIPVFETAADDSGRFVVHSEHLPSVPYEIRFTDVSGNPHIVATKAFIAENSAIDPDRKQYFAFQPTPENADVLGDFTTYDDMTLPGNARDLPDIGASGRPDGMAVVVAVFLMLGIIISTSLVGLYITRLPRKQR